MKYHSRGNNLDECVPFCALLLMLPWCANLASILSTWTVIPREGPNKRQFVVSRDILCVSPVLKGWIEEPDARPDFVTEGRISLNGCDAEVVDMVISYLKQNHSCKKFEFPSTDLKAMFFVDVYKLAGSLGYDPGFIMQCLIWRLMLQT